MLNRRSQFCQVHFWKWILSPRKPIVTVCVWGDMICSINSQPSVTTIICLSKYLTELQRIHVIPVYSGWEDCSYTALFNLHQGCHNSLLIYRMHLVRWCMYVTVNFFDFSEFLRLFGLLSTLFNHLWCPKNCSSIIPFYLRKLLARWHFACGCIVCWLLIDQ